MEHNFYVGQKIKVVSKKSMHSYILNDKICTIIEICDGYVHLKEEPTPKGLWFDEIVYFKDDIIQENILLSLINKADELRHVSPKTFKLFLDHYKE